MKGGGSKSSDPARGGLLVFLFWEVKGHLRIGARWADGIEVSGDEFGYMGIASFGDKGGLQGGGVSLGEGPRSP